MTDSKMPERISLLPDDGYSWCEGWPVHEPDRVEYIRADLAHPAPVTDAELEALAETAVRNWLGEMEGFATRGERFFDAVQNGDDMMPWLVAAATSALRARTAHPVGARVKPLEWEESVKGRWIGTPPVKLSDLAFWVFLRGDEFGRVTKNGWEYYPTLEAAKAAAQADYDQRILSVLLPEGGE